MGATRIIKLNASDVVEFSAADSTATDTSKSRTALPQARNVLENAADILRRGRLVAFPTETVYGLGAHALDTEAVERIYAAKGRPPTNPVIVHVADVAAARGLSSSWPADAETLAQAFWPGPLTLVLPKADAVPDIVTAGRATVALRVPAHPIALALLRVAALPVAAPSANISTNLSPTTAEHVLRGLEGRIDLVIDGGPTTGGIESTVIDLTGTQPTVLRPGLIGTEALSRALGTPVTQPTVTTTVHEAASAPGQQVRHYSPRTPLTLADDDGWSCAETFAREGQRIAWVRFGDWNDAIGSSAEAPASNEATDNILKRQLPMDAVACAAVLYALLHELDELDLDRIVVAQPPAGEAWRAIRDRLRRAAAK